MENCIIHPIGIIRADEAGFRLELQKRYAPALTGLEGFSHVFALWCFSACDDEASRSRLTMPSPYRGSPAVLGTFATRSPQRPNPIALSCAEVIRLDSENGIVELAYIDAEDGTPLIDLKPYTPSLDRVENPAVPDWCASWPKCTETSGDFDWGSVFQF